MKWYPEPDLNRHAFRRGILNPLCLPIPPPGHREVFFIVEIGTYLTDFIKFGAANETRTRDIHVGNVMLYQLSYSRFIIFLMLSEN